MSGPVYSQPLRSAYALLFGAPATATERAGFALISELELKEAWRRRVFAVHPDRARILGRSEAELAAECVSLNDAYALLNSYRDAPEAVGPSVPRSPRGASSAPPVAPMKPLRPEVQTRPVPPVPPAKTGRSVRHDGGQRADLFWTGSVPHRTLRFSEYMYYTGAISYQALVSSLGWQRIERPRFGAVAIDLGHLSLVDIHEILAVQRTSLPSLFGAVAAVERLLTAHQAALIAAKQRTLGPQIGQYFLECGALDRQGLTRAMVDQGRHNGRFAVSAR